MLDLVGTLGKNETVRGESTIEQWEGCHYGREFRGNLPDKVAFEQRPGGYGMWAILTFGGRIFWAGGTVEAVVVVSLQDSLQRFSPPGIRSLVSSLSTQNRADCKSREQCGNRGGVWHLRLGHRKQWSFCCVWPFTLGKTSCYVIRMLKQLCERFTWKGRGPSTNSQLTKHVWKSSWNEVA